MTLGHFCVIELRPLRNYSRQQLHTTYRRTIPLHFRKSAGIFGSLTARLRLAFVCGFAQVRNQIAPEHLLEEGVEPASFQFARVLFCRGLEVNHGDPAA